ncbi:uncharacterized protein Z520_02467 [Fonsecaea multimorphosa CBS 102226]|uniref:Uncharacterized protein n=1 Tax=Fonsecaea multimorphosa CBS 102226 TaxID=1442371 RepID=A0A0D2L013_9EURO|nr:uncharacterized protein Z520_02467 [Fonsecaea multimorphosa CBS 102226]KIY02329.1 hypothetical protein Z520_02467 [Fonsecaea multimorphosa CBS 102226]OAL28973.1 hypothetical protein AYO22_02409 [Fonsecaea multimorphosa]
MSQIFGKVTNAVLSGTNENSFSLANLNLGFSLVTLEAPAEFHPLGSALSHHRRQTAEEGSHHQTARMLGALFSQVAPNAPKLLRAFGERVSEIIKSPGANPTGTIKDGPFKDSVGADATSIWAAATSGSASLAVLLLACLLARKFDDPKLSVAIWAEIVAIRQKEVIATAQSDGFAMNEAVIAAHQKILREDLATFDASVRAWLITADQVKVKQLKQLTLILDNLTTLPVSTGKDTYAKIINAWETAINGFEALLDGKPQNATDSSVLLALSAWHLYPDLIVLSSETKKVVFQDPLFPPSVAITVGLSLRNNDQVSPGFQWSLALSHLRYYGQPVRVETDHDNYRITMDELCLIAFGSLLSHWRLPMRIMNDVASWFCSLDNLLQEHYHNRLRNEDGGFLLWLQPLTKASKLLVNLSEDDSANFEKLVRYGGRRGKHLLGYPSRLSNGPFFGLCNLHVVHGMSIPSTSEEYLRYVRSVAETTDILTFAVIQYWETVADTDVCVLATATPYTRSPHQDSTAEGWQQQKFHARWVFTGSSSHLTEVKRKLAHDQAPSSELVEAIDPHKYTMLGTIAREGLLNVPQTSFYWSDPPPFESAGFSEKQCWWNGVGCQDQQNGDKAHATAEENDPLGRGQEYPDPYNPSHIRGSETRQSVVSLFCPVWAACDEKREIGLFAVYEGARLFERQLAKFCLLQSSNMAALNSEETLQRAHLENFVGERVARHFGNMDFLPSRDEQSPGIIKSSHALQSQVLPSFTSLRHLHGLALMSQLYGQLPHATFPIKIAETPFYVFEYYLGGDPKHRPRSLSGVSRVQALAGICTMEAGGIPVDLSLFDRAFAIAAGNSIFVPESLLSDPSHCTPPYAIRRIVGNLGRPGVSLLVSPETVMVKEKTTDFRAIEHAPYDHKREDNFGATSLHLLLTGWQVPVALPCKVIGNIDQDVFQVEAVVSVHDRGHWYAHIDILATLQQLRLHYVNYRCSCGSRQDQSQREYTSIDNFEELLDPPDGVGIFRAHNNWSARLAATCIARQTMGLRKVFILNNDEVCWACLESAIEQKTARIDLSYNESDPENEEENGEFLESESDTEDQRAVDAEEEGEFDAEEDGCTLIIID